MQKEEKERVVAELTERLRVTETLIVADYRGLTNAEIDALRTKLLEHGARFTVVKNTLTKRAAEAAGTTGLLTLLEGPTAIAFLETDGDPVAVAKALERRRPRDTKVLAIRGGMLEGDEIGEDDRALAKLPPADVLRAQLVGAIVSPLTTIVALLAAPLRDLVGLIDARIEQLEEQGETSTPEPSRAAGEAAAGRRRPRRHGAESERKSRRPRRARSGRARGAEQAGDEPTSERAAGPESPSREPKNEHEERRRDTKPRQTEPEPRRRRRREWQPRWRQTPTRCSRRSAR